MDMISFLASEPFDRSVIRRSMSNLNIESPCLSPARRSTPRRRCHASSKSVSGWSYRAHRAPLLPRSRHRGARGAQTRAGHVHQAPNLSARHRPGPEFQRADARSGTGSELTDSRLFKHTGRPRHRLRLKVPEGHPSGGFAACVSPTTNPWSSTTSISRVTLPRAHTQRRGWLALRLHRGKDRHPARKRRCRLRDGQPRQA